MPLYIVRQDITKMKCDAIVNAANNTLLGGGGVDGCIHRVAGAKLLEECKTLGGCKTGEAKITKGYNLPCKYVIHTVGPIWSGGTKGEKLLLTSCYNRSLELALESGCESVAFPLISSGAYGYPKDKALQVATSAIKKFLEKNDLEVYLVVYDKKAYQISAELYADVSAYVDDNYVDESGAYNNCYRCSSVNWLDDYPRKSTFDGQRTRSKFVAIDTENDLISLLSRLDDNFAVTLFKLIDAKKMDEVECYKKANVSKQTWYKILNDENYRPSKNTILAFAIALKLSLEETERLLATVGFTLSSSSKFDVIIEYFILRGEYDIHKINETLFKFDQVCLGV